MTIDEWLALNPNHRFKCRADMGRTRVTLYGGEGIDKEISGYGENVAAAQQNAVDSRKAIKAALP